MGEDVVVVIDGDVVRLDDPSDLKGFKVVVENGTENQVMQALAQVGRMSDHDTAWIRADAVRALAAGRVADGWGEAFQGMLEYAAGKGWMSADGTEIQAHIEWAFLDGAAD